MEKIDVAIIGSGPTAIYLLKHLLDNSSDFKTAINSITIFEKSKIGGMGMPYHPEMTDYYNMSNISSEEIPEMVCSFAHWLKEKPKEFLQKLNVREFPIDKSKVYSRLALGYYFKEQYEKITMNLKRDDFQISELFGMNVIDVIPETETNKIKVKVQDGKEYPFSKVIIATGHMWAENDQPENGYFDCPWPIHKYLPKKGDYFNFTIGILGASLSALDVVTSLAHRHGKFNKTSEGLKFTLDKKAKNFKIVMYSAEGWLPHLQYEQEKPIREIYRHTSRDKLLALIDDVGFLSLDAFFDKICRPALVKAFEKDENLPDVQFLKQESTSFKEFVTHMADKHEYVNSFEGMRKELETAQVFLKQDKPTHWMETLDDLMYCLNFHSELLSAEDFIFLKNELMPFLMNVIAALPITSANILLALYDAGCIELTEGRVEILEHQKHNKTLITVENDKLDNHPIAYNLFINCSGQGNIAFNDFPFPSLIQSGLVREAKTEFKNSPGKHFKEKNGKNILILEDQAYLITGGIEIDGGYRVIRSDGAADARICDVSFVHTAGCRPYSYGLQACNATSLILVEEWKKSLLTDSKKEISIESITRTYESNDRL